MTGMALDAKFWKVLAGLGVPGVALGVFYKLYDKFDWPLAKLTHSEVAILAGMFMVLIAVIVIVALLAYRPRVQTLPNGAISASIPRNWNFKDVTKFLAKPDVVEFRDFTNKELAVIVESGELTASNRKEILQHIGLRTEGKLPEYTVTQEGTGKVVVQKL